MAQRLIDADAMTNELIKGIEEDTDKSIQSSLAKSVCMLICKAIERQPTIDAEPVRHGKWRQTYLDHEAFGERPSIFYCSACCACSNVKTNYCPNCGARMDEERKEE